MKRPRKIYSDDELLQYWDKDSAFWTDRRLSESEVFEIIYDRYCDRVYSYCIRRLNENIDKSKDILQETFVNFYNKIKTGYKVNCLYGFLVGIARNLCLNYFNREMKRNVSIGDDMTQIENLYLNEDYSWKYEADDLFSMILRALQTIDAPLREAFEMREFSKMKYREIAEACGIPLGTAKDRVYSAHEKIKKILSPYIKELKKN